jgi:FkbM family methyltransferase
VVVTHRLVRLIGAPFRRVERRLASFRFDRAIEVHTRDDLRRLGSEYGGYVVPMRLLGPDSICYSCGIGEDATFDVELIAATGCAVYAFDPTPRAAAYAESIAEGEERFVFLPYGVWSSDGPRRFYAPADEAHVSHSITNLQQTTTYFEAECRRLKSLMSELGHRRIDLLKLDVEGAEYEILSSVIDRRLDVRIVSAELHRVTSIDAMIAFVKELVRAGFDVVHSRDLNVTFVRRAASSTTA